MTIQRQERKDSFEFTCFIRHTNPIPHTNPQAHGSLEPRGQFVALEKLSTANVATSATSPDDGHATLLLYIRVNPAAKLSVCVLLQVVPALGEAAPQRYCQFGTCS